jgi:hypothetical protein
MQRIAFPVIKMSRGGGIRNVTRTIFISDILFVWTVRSFEICVRHRNITDLAIYFISIIYSNTSFGFTKTFIRWMTSNTN